MNTYNMICLWVAIVLSIVPLSANTTLTTYKPTQHTSFVTPSLEITALVVPSPSGMQDVAAFTPMVKHLPFPLVSVQRISSSQPIYSAAVKQISVSGVSVLLTLTRPIQGLGIGTKTSLSYGSYISADEYLASHAPAMRRTSGNPGTMPNPWDQDPNLTIGPLTDGTWVLLLLVVGYVGCMVLRRRRCT